MKKMTHKLCRTCKYYSISVKCCDYAEMTGLLRTAENHKIREDLPKGWCDKYEKYVSEGGKKGARAVEKRVNWVRIKGCQ